MPLPAAEIARLGPDDWPELKTIRLEALRREPAAFSSAYADWANRPEEDWRKRLELPGSATLVARRQGRPVGMAGAIFGADGESHVAMIVGMYVNAEYRRSGIGRMLLRALAAEIVAQPAITTIRLWVTPAQEAARRFYASLGFQEVKDPDRSTLDGPGPHEEIAMERAVNEEEA